MEHSTGLQRIVKMTFKPEHCAEFEHFFETIRDRIAGQPGCRSVDLLRDTAATGIYFTYSQWVDQASLDAYRETELFNVVWPTVKVWFAAKPEAWSTERISRGIQK